MDRVYVVWTDSNGQTRLSWYSYAAGASLPPFAAALQAVVNPTATQVVAGSVQAPGGTPSSNPYLSVNDCALLSFGTAAGGLVGVLCPGFQEALYASDNQTVDIAQPLVVSLVNAALALPIVSSVGSPVVSYVGGIRQLRGF